MSSLMKKSFQLGKAVYATVNEIVAEQTNKPAQHPQGGYYNQPGGSYQQTQIPGQYTAQGQHNATPPTLPPRPANHTPSPQAYTPQHQQGYGPVYGQQTAVPPLQASPPYNQTAYTPPVGQTYDHPAYHVPGPYAALDPKPQGTGQSPVHMAPQTVGTMSAMTSTAPSQTNWNSTSPLPSPPVDQSVGGQPPVTGWGPSPPLSTAPSAPPPSWTPVSPLPTTATPHQAQGPYTPPTPLNAPLQPFPAQYTPITPITPSSTTTPQYDAPSHPPAHIPTPPLSPPLPSPPIAQSYNQGAQYSAATPAPQTAQAYNQGSQYAPTSPAPQAAAPYAAQPGPYFNPTVTSTSPPAHYPSYNAPPTQHPSPPTQYMQSPVSPAASSSSQLPHPPAFVSELPANDITLPQQPPAPAAPPQQAFTPVPEGYAELPAELPSESAAQPNADAKPVLNAPGSTPPTIPAAAVTPSTAVEQPKPVHPPPQQQPAPLPAAYAPQPYAPVQNTQTPPAVNNYQPYQPSQPVGAPQHSPPQDQAAPAQSGLGQAAYKPYTPPSQSSAQFSPQNAQGPPVQQQPGVPQRMGSLASKFSHMGINNGPSQYAPYAGAASPEMNHPQGQGATLNSTAHGYAPNAPQGPPYH